MFLADIVLSFFTSIPETEYEEEIMDKKIISVKYLSGWFLIDFLSIIPVHVLFDAHDDYNLF